MARLIMLVGGGVLLLMVAVLSPLRQDANGAFWMVTGTYMGPPQVSGVRFDIAFPDGRVFREAYRTDAPQTVPSASIVGWSPDGRWIMYVETTETLGGRIVRKSVDGDQARVLTEYGCANPLLSPDERWMVLCEIDQLRDGIHENLLLFDADGRFIRRLTPDGIRHVVRIYWSPDSARVYYNTREPRGEPRAAYFYQISIANAVQTRLYDDYVEPYFSPDSSQIILRETVAVNLTSLYLMDADTGAMRELLTINWPYFVEAWLPSDVLILYQRGSAADDLSARLATFDLETKELTVLYQGDVRQPVFSREEGLAYYMVREHLTYRIFELDLGTLATRQRYERSERFEMDSVHDRPWVWFFGGDRAQPDDLRIYDLTTATEGLGAAIVRFPLWAFESEPIYSPSVGWVYVAHYQPSGDMEMARIQVGNSAYSTLDNRWIVGFSPLIDLGWKTWGFAVLGGLLILLPITAEKGYWWVGRKGG